MLFIGITAGDINNLDNSSNENRRNNCQNNSNSNSNMSNNANSNLENNGLLRDLIKILTIKELLNRNNVRRFPFTYGNINPYGMWGMANSGM